MQRRRSGETVLKNLNISNTFTPNGDGINDTWKIKYLETYPGNTVNIYNRYGEKVYSSVGYGVPWDGTRNGTNLPAGTYYYIIDPKNSRGVVSGSVTIIR
jgi:gliding motility-associated-like protein